MIARLGAIEQAQHQALVRIAHGLALGAVAQIGVDAPGEHLLQALVAAVVRVNIGVGHNLGDELVLNGTGSAGDRLASEVLNALDGIAAERENAYERLIVATREVVGLLALFVGAHCHGKGLVIALHRCKRGGKVLRLKVVRKAQARGHLVGNGDIQADNLLLAVRLRLQIAIGCEGVVAHKGELGSLDIVVHNRSRTSGRALVGTVASATARRNHCGTGD